LLDAREESPWDTAASLSSRRFPIDLWIWMGVVQGEDRIVGFLS